MRNRLNALQILVVFSVLQKTCRGTNCYQCRSDEDKRCSDQEVDLSFLRLCPKANQNYCRKVDYTLYFTDMPDTIVIRECAELRSVVGNCYRGRYTHDSHVYTCECKGSGCNHSPLPTTHFPIPFLILIVSLQFALRFILNPI